MKGNIPDRQDLERCLGEGYRLDGSFASLWAIEVILNTLRKQPQFQRHGDWIPAYLTALLKRAYGEMGIPVEECEDLVLYIRDSDYRQNVYQDYQRLLKADSPFPTIAPQTWQEAPVLNLASAPWYGLAALLRAQPWAEGRVRTYDEIQPQSEPALDWLVREYLRTEFKEKEDEEFKDMAACLLTAMFWPPLVAPGNQFADHNLNQICKIFKAQKQPDTFINTLLRLLVSQDRLVSLLAGASCFLISIAPTSPRDARALRRCTRYFRTLPASISGEPHDRVLEVIHMLGSSIEAPLKGGNEPEYLETIAFSNQNKYALAAEKITTLIARFPNNPLYHRTRGRLMERLGKDAYAIEDYNRALYLKADYWQALVNRGGFYVRKGAYPKAHADFLAAIKIRPDCETTRDNLLETYFLSKQA